MGIAHNVLRESVRRDRIQTRAREKLGLPLDLATDDRYREVEERLSPRFAVADALERLSIPERDAVELRVLEQLSYGDIAERLAIRPAAARFRVSHALRRLALVTSKEEP